MRKNILVLLCASFLLLPQFSVAQKDSEKIQQIKKLIEVTDAAALLNDVVEIYAKSYAGQFEEHPQVLDTLMSILKSAQVDLIDSIVLIYDDMYTEKEIKKMIKLYQTPIGKKMIETMPELSKRSQTAGENWALANEQMIIDRLTPLIPEPKEPLTYDELYNENEVYISDEPFEFSTPESSKVLVKGSDFNYGLWYNDELWTKLDDYGLSSAAEIGFKFNEKEAYAMLIAEKRTFTLQQLKAAALTNMFNGAPDAEVSEVRMRSVNGNPLLKMCISGSVNGYDLKYINYYLVTENGSVQFIVFTVADDFEALESEMYNILNGLVIL